MAVKILLGFGFLFVCCLLEVSSRPNNESTKIAIPLNEQVPTEEERSITFTKEHDETGINLDTREIIKKIQAINDGLKKSHRQQLNNNKPQAEITTELTHNGNYGVDRETLEKIQQLIASAKHKQLIETKQQDESNYLNEDPNEVRYEHSRALQMVPNTFNQPSTSFMSPFPQIMNMPVVIIPFPNNIRYANNDINSIQPASIYQTRQEQPSPFPSFPTFPSNIQWPFQFQWPFANLFPLIVKDPFVALQQGGGWNNFFEYGQSADVCARKKRANDEDELKTLFTEFSKTAAKIQMIFIKLSELQLNETRKIEAKQRPNESIDLGNDTNTRKARAIKKRTVANTTPDQKIDAPRKSQKIYVAKPVLVTRKPPKKVYIEEAPEDTKSDVDNADLRFPFGGFDWFGNKKPVVPSPGFFINRLRVRKGGVAIAGPGGVATAGRGGTAIVGPGGLAYTQPGGLAVAGPAARVIALSSETDLNSVVTRLRELNDASHVSASLEQPIREGKLVATGPVVYYHPDEKT